MDSSARIADSGSDDCRDTTPVLNSAEAAESLRILLLEDSATEAATRPSVACDPRLDSGMESRAMQQGCCGYGFDPIGEVATATSLSRGPCLDPIGEAERIERALYAAGMTFTCERVATREAFERVLEGLRPDVVIVDYQLRESDAHTALRMVRARHPEIPVIIVTASLGDEAAVELFKAGAKDYVLKDHLARLAPAIERVCAMEQGIRSRKRAEAALRDSEARYRRLFESARDGILLLDAASGTITDVNPSLCELVGCAHDELVGSKLWETGVFPDCEDGRALFAELQRHGQVRRDDLALAARDGRTVAAEFVASTYDYDHTRVVQCNIRDITERKSAVRALATLSACNAALVRAGSEAQLLQQVCHVIVEQGGYRCAWIGFADPIAEAGAACSLRAPGLGGCDGGAAQSAATAAMRRNESVIVRDAQADPSFAPWREQLEASGIGSLCVLPLSLQGAALGVLSICSRDRNAFSAEEMVLLAELAQNLTFGINALRTREERDRALVQHERGLVRLRENLEDTITAIAATVEMRDPYTAGHETRVARLATAIARELGLPESRIEGIRFGALIHDVGKITVPTELLSKPGALSRYEFELVKDHTLAGYEILKGIKFPWPVAEMVLQHHERLDGSGYPNGLTAGQILLEARILAVADVVEAMASHRPYRPALGIEAALAEIGRFRGSRYDAAAVDVCTVLFRERGFSLD